MTFHPYVAAVPPCSGKAQKGTSYLQAALLERFDASFDYGIYNCRALTTNAAVPSIHSDGRAGDLGFPDAVTKKRTPVKSPHPQGFIAVEILRVNAWDLGIMGIIWNRRRWSARNPWGAVYNGPNPHVDHVHFEQEPNLATNLSLDDVYDLIGDPPMSFTAAQEATLKMLADALTKPGPTTGRVGNGESLIHVLEVHRLVAAEIPAISPLDHNAIRTRLLGQ